MAAVTEEADANVVADVAVAAAAAAAVVSKELMLEDVSIIEECGWGLCLEIISKSCRFNISLLTVTDDDCNK